MMDKENQPNESSESAGFSTSRSEEIANSKLDELEKNSSMTTKRVLELQSRLAALEQSWIFNENEIFARLLERTGESKEDLISKAMTLYEAALDARDKGNRLVILTQDYQFVREIIGFGTNRHEDNLKHGVVAG